MKFFKKNINMQQSDVIQSRRFTLGQYVAAVSVMVVSVTALSYAAGILTLNKFEPNKVISAHDMNDNFEYVQANLKAMAASMVSMQTTIAGLTGATPPTPTPGVPVGTLVAFSGATVPAGYIRCPTDAGSAIVSTAVYPALYAAIGTTWGTTTNSSVFVMPWFPEGYTLLQTNLAVSVQYAGQVIEHSHTPPIGLTYPWVGNATTADGALDGSTTISGYDRTVEKGNTGITGGLANFAAGTKVMILVKI